MATTTGTQAEQKQEETRVLLRLFLNDTPELNRLIRTEESPDPKLDLAIALAISDNGKIVKRFGELQIYLQRLLVLRLRPAIVIFGIFEKEGIAQAIAQNSIPGIRIN